MADASKKYVTKSEIGTAASKNYTTAVTQNSTDLVTSGAVYNVIGDIETLLASI